MATTPTTDRCPMAAFAAKRPPTSLHVQTWHCLSAKESIPRTRRHTERRAGQVCRKCGRRTRPGAGKDGRVGTRSGVQGRFAANAAVQEKNLASAVKNPPNGILSGPNFSLFRQISTTFSQTIVSSNSINNYPNEKKTRIKNKMHAIFFFPIIMKSPIDTKQPEYQPVSMQ